MQKQSRRASLKSVNATQGMALPEEAEENEKEEGKGGVGATIMMEHELLSPMEVQELKKEEDVYDDDDAERKGAHHQHVRSKCGSNLGTLIG